MIDEMIIENQFLKLKIIQYQREYLAKKGITHPNAKNIQNMRKAVSSRLANELKEIDIKHNEIFSSVLRKSV